MPINNNIYNINWNKLVSWLIPNELFFPKVLAWCKSIVSPVSTLHGNFLAFRKQKNYELNINSQVCKLEKLLNDKFDNTFRRIYITDGELSKKKYVFTTNEFVPLPIYTLAENNPLFIYKEGEITTNTYHFIVNVPSGIRYSNNVMISVLNTFKLPSKKYDIVIF